MSWWKLLFETKTQTWNAFGRVVFVAADDEAAGLSAAVALASSEYPGAQIIQTSFVQSTEAAAKSFAERVEKYRQWLDNTGKGVPNNRGDL